MSADAPGGPQDRSDGPGREPGTPAAGDEEAAEAAGGPADPRLLELAQRVADGDALDWTEVTGTSDPASRPAVEALQAIAAVGRAHRAAGRRRRGPDPDAGDLAPGQTWGGLELLRRIGRGSYGEVWEALDTRLDRRVALKLIPAGEGRGEVVDAAVAEGRMLARIRHPNVATVHGADHLDGRVGIWMELIQGRTVAERVAEEGPSSAQEATLVGIDLCRALSAVHGQGILHRDVKAQNVMREDGGRTVLFDFGIGRELEASSGDDLIGTPLYMAPEVIAGSPATVAADVYGLGVFLYHLVSGGFPVTGSSLEEVREAHGQGHRRLLRDLRADLPVEFVAVVERALAADPAARYASMGEMEQALIGVLATMTDRPLQARRSDAPPPPARRRRRAPPAWLALPVLLVAVLLAVWLLPGEVEPPVPPGGKVFLHPVANETGDAELDGVGRAFEVVVDQSAYFDLVTAGADEEPTDEELWRRGVLVTVDGAVSRIGDDFLLFVTLSSIAADPVRPRRLAMQRFPAASRQELFDALDEAAVWTRRHLGEAAADVDALALSVRGATSGSWRAVKLFGEHYALNQDGQIAAAVDLLDRAIQEDPDFALAHARRADLLASLDSSGHLDSWERALALAAEGRLTRKEELQLRAQAAADVGDVGAALQAYRDYAAAFPHEYLASFGLAMTLHRQDQSAEALEILREMDARWRDDDYYRPQTLARLAEVSMALGQFAAAAGYLERLRAEAGADESVWPTVADIWESRLLFLRGDYAAAVRRAREVAPSPHPEYVSMATTNLAALLAEVGRFEEARRVLERDPEVDDGLPGYAALRHLALARLAARDGRHEEMQDHVDRAVAASSDPRLLVVAGTLLARQGLPGAAAGLLSRIGSDDRVPLYEIARSRIQGEIELAEGRPQAALEAFDVARTHEPRTRSRGYLARAQAAAGRWNDAVETWEATCDRTGHLIFDDDDWEARPGLWADCLEGWARAAEEAGIAWQAAEVRARLAGLRAGAENRDGVRP